MFLLIRYYICTQQLWDHIYLVRHCIDNWKTTPWRNIDVESMDIECKKFAKDLRGKVFIYHHLFFSMSKFQLDLEIFFSHL